MRVHVVWDLDDDPAGNVQHLEEHGVTKEEVEEVLAHHLKDWETSRTTGSPLTFGTTTTGRHLAVVFEWIDPTEPAVRPVMAYDTPPRQRRPRKKR